MVAAGYAAVVIMSTCLCNKCLVEQVVPKVMNYHWDRTLGTTGFLCR